MAADVQNTENSDTDSHITSLFSEIESCSIAPSSHTSDASSVCGISTLPSYVIVQKQMEEVVVAQQETLDRLVRNNIEVLNQSKTNFDLVVSSQDQKILMLENTIKENYVAKEMHDSLRIEMKREYENHMQTRAKLQEVLSKLDTSLTQITVLKKQMEDDKRTFHSVCESLRQKTEEIQARNRDLESRLTEKSLLCERQQSQVSQQSQEIAGLLEKQQTQSRKYQHMMMEADVEKQQEVYLSQIFSGRNKKKV